MTRPFDLPIVKGIFRGRFHSLLVCLLLLLAIAPLISGFVGLSILMNIFLTAILVTGIQAIHGRRIFTVIALLLALPLLITMWASYVVELPAFLRLTGNIFGLLFFAHVTVLILFHVFKVEKVSGEVICGAVVVYLLMGVTWGLLYALIEIIQPGSFAMAGSLIDESRLRFIYFSFITLSTLGYGDITPLTPPASAFSLLEAVIGQIYLAVLVARLIGLHISQPRS